MRNFFLFLFFIPATAFACFNDYYHDANGNPVTNNELEMLIYKRNFDYNALDKKITAFEKNTKPKTYKDSSDFAVVLAKRGYIYRALQILETLAKRMPEDYTIAANLGTCYELVGKNDAALAWIKKGIRINPQSHKGSEWVHVKILEAKIALAKDPNWLSANKVLGLPGQIAVAKSTDKKENGKNAREQRFDSLERHVIYQLTERLPFTTPPDAVMASVLKELAWYEEQAAVEVAIMHYKYAQEYAGGKDEKLRETISTLNRRFNAMIEKAMVEKGEDADMRYTSRSPYLVQQMFAKSKAYKVRDSATSAIIPVAAEPKLDTVKADSAKVQASTPVTETPAKESDSSKMWLFIIAGIAIIGGGMWFMRRK